jgi:hypothetical protein
VHLLTGFYYFAVYWYCRSLVYLSMILLNSNWRSRTNRSQKEKPIAPKRSAATDSFSNRLYEFGSDLIRMILVVSDQDDVIYRILDHRTTISVSDKSAVVGSSTVSSSSSLSGISTNTTTAAAATSTMRTGSNGDIVSVTQKSYTSAVYTISDGVYDAVFQGALYTIVATISPVLSACADWLSVFYSTYGTDREQLETMSCPFSGDMQVSDDALDYFFVTNSYLQNTGSSATFSVVLALMLSLFALMHLTTLSFLSIALTKRITFALSNEATRGAIKAIPTSPLNTKQTVKVTSDSSLDNDHSTSTETLPSALTWKSLLEVTALLDQSHMQNFKDWILRSELRGNKKTTDSLVLMLSSVAFLSVTLMQCLIAVLCVGIDQRLSTSLTMIALYSLIACWKALSC